MESKIKRWSAARKVQIVLDLLRGSKALIDVCRENDLKQSEVERWKEDFLKGGTLGLKAKSPSCEEDEIRELRAKVGELVLELDARKKLATLTESRRKAS